MKHQSVAVLASDGLHWCSCLT